MRDALEQCRLERDALAARVEALTSALARARREQADEQRGLAEVVAAVNSSLDLEQVLHTIVTRAVALAGADGGNVGESDLAAERWVTWAVHNVNPATHAELMGRNRPSAGLDWLQSGYQIADAAEPGEFAGFRRMVQGWGYRAALGTPIRREGTVVGFFNVFRKTPGEFPWRVVELLKTMADHTAVAIVNARQFRSLQETLEQQTATAEVLQAIASSPTELQPVLDVIAERAARLCDTDDAMVQYRHGDLFRTITTYGTLGTQMTLAQPSDGFPATVDTIPGRSILERRTVHVLDVLAEPDGLYERSKERARETGYRSGLATPMLLRGDAAGALFIRRKEVRAFTETQIRLLETFASQAIIAIENARLFSELQESNRTLKEALEQQTATAEVLQIIAQSPASVEPALAAIVESALRLCDGDNALLGQPATDALLYRASAQRTAEDAIRTGLPAVRLTLDRSRGYARPLLDARTVHIPDVTALSAANQFDGYDPEWVAGEIRKGHRSLLGTPLLRGGQAIGVLVVVRRRGDEARPFTDAETALLETFASQAVIAIENARLFSELQESNRTLKEALEQQTATADILRVIAGNPSDLGLVMRTIAVSVARLCGADGVRVNRVEGDAQVALARVGPSGGEAEVGVPVPIQRTWMTGRAILDRRTIHVHDLLGPDGEEFLGPRIISEQQDDPQRVIRTALAVPLVREGAAMGVIHAHRFGAARPFSDQQVRVLETFADQAVIAIENARLFAELQERLAEQTAAGQVLQVISRSPTDLQAVLDTIVREAARVCQAEDVVLIRVAGDVAAIAAHVGPIEAAVGARRRLPDTPRSASAAALLTGEVVHLHDVFGPEGEPYPITREQAAKEGTRTVLVVPLRHDDRVIGAISPRRSRVDPFTPHQIALIESFADQAVIAIENARLFSELQESNRTLKEALEQQTATAEVLQIIAGSPTNEEHALLAILDSAMRLCDANVAIVRQPVDGALVMTRRMQTALGEIETVVPDQERPAGKVPDRGWGEGRVFLEARTLHIPDVMALTAENGYDGYDQSWLAAMDRYRARTFLGTPLLRRGEPIGTLVTARTGDTARPFTPTQIALLETFAHQAVIAIENARLFTELQDSNRTLSDALEREKTTSEILRVIASSPTDLQAVLDIIAENAARLCGTHTAVIYRVEGDAMAIRGSYYAERYRDLYVDPPTREWTPLRLDWASGRAVLERRTVHLPNIDAADDYPFSQAIARKIGHRSLVVTPLLRRGEAIGAISVQNFDERPFTPDQIKLVETFADQAVIAIENTRLFTELQERLEEQTATADVLRIISESPTDLQPVLDAISERAAKVCDADYGGLYLGVDAGPPWDRHDPDHLKVVASFGVPPQGVTPNIGPRLSSLPGGVFAISAQAFHERRTIHVPDLPPAPTGPYAWGYRSAMSTPLLRRGNSIGVLHVRRTAQRPFADAQVRLLETFAAQAVIAIENARLFQELRERTRELARTVEELEALGAVTQAVSSTLDLEEVLRRIVGHARRLAGAEGGTVFEYVEEEHAFYWRAADGVDERLSDLHRQMSPFPADPSTAVGVVATTHRPMQADMAPPEDPDAPEWQANTFRRLSYELGTRHILAVPLLREDAVLGVLNLYRTTPGDHPLETVALVERFATQSALAIQNARLFREIEQKSRELEVASAHKSEFLAAMSHELRTPLNAVIGFSEVLLERMFGDINEKQEEYLRDILDSGRHLLSLINDILDLSKVEAGKMEPEPSTFSLPEALEGSLTMVRERATRHNIDLSLDIAPALAAGGQIEADERKVKQVVFNLLSNAVKFTPDGGQVALRAAPQDGQIVVAVRDTGIGIAPEDQTRIFEAFQQAGHAATQAREGTGLGLALARQFVELHGGRLWVESVVGKGSTFTFTLPLLSHAQDGRSIRTTGSDSATPDGERFAPTAPPPPH